MNEQIASSDKDSDKNKPNRKIKIRYILLFLFVVFIISTSAMVHKYGPYSGKVVDLETGAPIEGAAVVMDFCTETFYASGSYAGAVETVTDKNGEFNIPGYTAITFHPFSVWRPYGYVIIFKPGYGAYPDHDDSAPLFVPNGTLPEGQYVQIKLPKLKTIEERKRYLPSQPSVPKRKMKHFIKLINEESISLGFQPLNEWRLDR